ncbi:MAG: hypothetical protein JXB49_08065 [Bacteroidales bacterium]|nr:hypothetical protein [Bacteroidales bacterium]
MVKFYTEHQLLILSSIVLHGGGCIPFPKAGDNELIASNPRNFEIFEPLDFLAAVTQHIPDKGEYSRMCSGLHFVQQVITVCIPTKTGVCAKTLEQPHYQLRLLLMLTGKDWSLHLRMLKNVV